MSFLDYGILSAVALSLIGAFLWARRRSKQGKTCGGNCAVCPRCETKKRRM